MMNSFGLKFYSLMTYSHWSEPRPGHRPGTNGLYDTETPEPEEGLDLLSHIFLVPIPVPVSVPVLLSVNTL